MSDPNIASSCVADITAKIKTLDLFKNKAFEVYDYLALVDTTQDIKFPCVGVVYEGITTKGGDDRTGLATYLTCGIFMLAGDKDTEIKGTEKKADIVLMLDMIRNNIKRTKSPTMHNWEFMLEIPFDISKRGLGYYQKWKTTVILT